jgi:large subunit ribosomal protein L23
MLGTDIIKKPLVTEKSTFTSDQFNRVSFEVDRRASKPQIKQAVQELYKVRVLGVATKIRRGRVRRNRFGFYAENPVKQAIVKVHPEDKIELF